MVLNKESLHIQKKSNQYCNSCIGVVVLYNTGIEESKTILSLNKSLEFSNQTLDLVVYNNGKESCCDKGSTFNYGHFRIHYFHDPSNPGVSKAYNFAAQYGKDLKKDWLFLLDQDTMFSQDCIIKYMSAIQQNTEIKLIAPVLHLPTNKPISPCRYFLKRGFPLKKVACGILKLKKISLLNSGMLINLNAFSEVGGYNENVKLDFCDFLFIEEFKKTYNNCFIIDIHCIHDFADNNMDIIKLKDRYSNYCRDAKNCPQDSIIDWFQYFIVVALRASSLALRTGNFGFYKTLIENFLKASNKKDNHKGIPLH